VSTAHRVAQIASTAIRVSPSIAPRILIAFVYRAVAVFARRRRGWWIIARIVRPRLDP